METKINEIADGIYRLSTHVPGIAPPAGLGFNQFVIRADEPLMFHTGLRKMFPLKRDAVGKILPVKDLRWISFGHYEADECGSMTSGLPKRPRRKPRMGRRGSWCHSTTWLTARRASWRMAR